MHVWLATTPSLIGSEDMYHTVCSVNMQVITESQNIDRWYQLIVERASARTRSTSVTVDSLLTIFGVVSVRIIHPHPATVMVTPQ